MPLEFRSGEDEGFSFKRFLKTVAAGVAVFFVFMAVGYYLVAPRIVVTEEGHLAFRLWIPRTETTQPAPAAANTLPKVEVYEKLPPEVTAGTGTLIGSREVAPFDYERYQRKRRERRSQPPPAPTPDATEETAPPDDEYLVPDDSDETLPSETPEPEPAEPLPETPPSQPSPPTPEPETSQQPLYRVQVGVYESRENANQVVQSLIESNFEASIVPFQRDGKTLYRVQVLVTRDKAKADALKSQLESKGFPTVVTKTP